MLQVRSIISFRERQALYATMQAGMRFLTRPQTRQLPAILAVCQPRPTYTGCARYIPMVDFPPGLAAHRAQHFSEAPEQVRLMPHLLILFPFSIFSASDYF